MQIPQPGNWNLTSPSGSIATLARPITNAVLTFTTPVTGTVQIVGAQRPRRLSEFSESRGVAARDLNQVLNGIEVQLREMWDRQFRTVQAPPGETLNVLPVQASRANMGACFDTNGNLAPCIAGAGSFIAGSGIGFAGTNPTTISYTGDTYAAGFGINFSGTNPTVISTDAGAIPYVMPSSYGIVCNGVTDVTTAFQTMVNASAGKVIFLPPGPACVISSHLTLISNTTIIGGGRDVSGIKITGADYIFNLTNISNVTLKDFYLLGTNAFTSWAITKTGAIAINASTAQSNLTFRNLTLSGFNGNYWINGQQSAGIISNTTFDNLLILTNNANVPTDPDPINNTNGAIILFSGGGGSSRWENTTISNIQINQDGLCYGIILFSNHYKFNITNNRFLNPGGTNPNAHCTNGLSATNAYGIAIYDLFSDGNPPNHGLITNNYILNPIAAGIYLVGDGISFTRGANSFETLISGNMIVGQTHTDTLLPRGGIVVNLSTDVSVVGNYLYNNQSGSTSPVRTPAMYPCCRTIAVRLRVTPFASP